MKKHLKKILSLLLVITLMFYATQLLSIFNEKKEFPSPKKIIIIGGTSGIGKALAEKLLQKKCMVGIAGRRVHLLDDLKNKYKNNVFIKKIDVTKTKEAVQNFKDLIKKMDGVDIVVLSSGIGHLNKKLELEKEIKTINVNVSGFVAMANVAFKQFLKQKHGHLVGISSIVSHFGNSIAPAYNASKSFVNTYLTGLRYKVHKTNLPITITNILPGAVDTPMLKADKYFWVATPQKAADQIHLAIVNKKEHVYVTKRWKLIAWIIKLMPEFIRKRIF